MDERTGRFRRTDRLLTSRDFKRITGRGSRSVNRDFVVVMGSGSDSESGYPRLGLSVSRRVGGAVIRNHIKRRVREWFRRKRDELPRNRDIVVIARAPASRLGGAQIATSLAELMRRAGAIRS